MKRMLMIPRRASRLVRFAGLLGLVAGSSILFTPGTASAAVTGLTITSATVAKGVVTINGTVTCTTQGNVLAIAFGAHQSSTGADSGISQELLPACASDNGVQTWTATAETHVYTQSGKAIGFRHGSALVDACARDITAGDTDFTVCTGLVAVTLTRTH